MLIRIVAFGISNLMPIGLIAKPTCRTTPAELWQQTGFNRVGQEKYLLYPILFGLNVEKQATFKRKQV